MDEGTVRRFFAKTRRADIPRPGMDTPCLEWIAGKDKDGYGKFGNGRAHRFAWEVKHGPVPFGILTCHRCDNPPCVDESHLFLGTNVDNMRDMARKCRSMRGERNRKAKLSEADIVRAFEMRAERMELKQIAKELHVSFQLISQILRREVWSHVDISSVDNPEPNQGGTNPA